MSASPCTAPSRGHTSPAARMACPRCGTSQSPDAMVAATPPTRVPPAPVRLSEAQLREVEGGYDAAWQTTFALPARGALPPPPLTLHVGVWAGAFPDGDAESLPWSVEFAVTLERAGSRAINVLSSQDTFAGVADVWPDIEPFHATAGAAFASAEHACARVDELALTTAHLLEVAASDGWDHYIDLAEISLQWSNELGVNRHNTEAQRFLGIDWRSCGRILDGRAAIPSRADVALALALHPDP